MATEKISAMTLISNASTTDLHEVSRLVSTSPDVWVTYSESNAQLITLLTTSLPSVQLNYNGLNIKDPTNTYLLNVIAGSAQTANRSLTLSTGNANRTFTISGNLSFANDFQTLGNYPITLNASASTNVTLPVSGNLSTANGVETLTNKTISGASNTLSNIGNSSLVYSAITINGNSVSLGGSTTVTAAVPYPLTVSTGLQLNSGTTYDGSVAKTISIGSSVATLTGSQTLTNKTMSGASNTFSNIGNSSLVYDSITINGESVSLGGSIDVSSETTYPLTAGTGLEYNTGTTFNGSVAKTMSINSSVVTLNGAQTLTDKTGAGMILQDNAGTPSKIKTTTKIIDNSDPTKTLSFNLSNVDTGVNLSIKAYGQTGGDNPIEWTLPARVGGLSDSFVGVYAEQTLLNKTGAGMTLEDYSGTPSKIKTTSRVIDNSDPTKTLRFDLSSMQTGVDVSIKVKGNYEVDANPIEWEIPLTPDSSGDTFAGCNTPQDLTDKTLINGYWSYGTVIVSSSDSGAVFTDNANATKTMHIDLSSLAGSTDAQLKFAAGVVITTPSVTSTLSTLGKNTYTGAQSVTPTALTSSSNHIATDASTSNVFTVTMTENTTLDNPTNLVTGTIYTWVFTQGASPYTLAFGNKFKWPGGTALTISTGSGEVDAISAVYNGTNLLTVISGQDFS